MNSEVDVHLLRRQARRLRGSGLCHRLHLHGRPDIAAVGAHMDGAVHRLHRRMCEKGHFVNGFDAFFAADARPAAASPALADLDARLLRALSE